MSLLTSCYLPINSFHACFEDRSIQPAMKRQKSLPQHWCVPQCIHARQSGKGSLCILSTREIWGRTAYLANIILDCRKNQGGHSQEHDLVGHIVHRCLQNDPYIYRCSCIHHTELARHRTEKVRASRHGTGFHMPRSGLDQLFDDHRELHFGR